MSETMQHSIDMFSCPGCGGRPVWDPESGKMKCPFCGTTSEVRQDRTKPNEYDIDAAPKAEDTSAAWGDEKHVVRCESCGAETILGKEESASFCPFCGSPRVLEDQTDAGIAPESVLPFRVTQKAAVEGFRKWLKRKWFAPSKAKKMAQLGQIAGVYLPHWTYDSDTQSRYIGQEGHWYYVNVTRTVTRDGKQVTETVQERRTRWVPTAGYVAHQFDDVVIPGSERLEQKLLETVQPYDLDQLCRYQAEFLSGFAAEKPVVKVHDGWEKAQVKIDQVMTQLARQDILSRADEAMVSSVSSTHENVKYKLTLLPMYLSSFNYKEKLYHVLVNGQTGKVGGQSPISALRVIAAIIIIGALLVGGFYLLEEMGFFA